MFGRTGQMFPRPRAYHDAIYEEEYGSETEEDCCRGRGISAIVCWLLSVIVLIGVAVAVVLTVFFVLRSRSPASTLEDLTTIFDNDLTFTSSLPTSVPAAASDEVPPNSGSSSFEDDWASTSTSSSSSSSTRSIFANSGHSSRRPTVYVDSSEIRQGGHRNNNFNKKTDMIVTHHQKPGFEAPSSSSTTLLRESIGSGNTNGKLTTRRYYSDTTGQAVQDVISKTTSSPPSVTTSEQNLNSAQSSSDERIPSASDSVEAIKKHSSQYFSEESSHSFQQHFPTKPPSEAHGTTLFTAAPSSGPKTSSNNKRGRTKGNTKPFVLYPNADTPVSSSEESVQLASTSTTKAPVESASSTSSEEAPQGKKVPSGFRPSNFEDPTTTSVTNSPGTTRGEDILTRIMMRNKNVGTGTTKKLPQPTTTPPTLSESEENVETTRRPGKMRTVVHRTTTTTQPPSVVLVTPSSNLNLIDRSSEEDQHQIQSTLRQQTSPETTTERPRQNDSSENIMDILVGSEDSKTLITKETDRGVITSAILPPWYQSDQENESPEEKKPNKQRETSPQNDHGLFRQPDLTALLDILSSSEGTKTNLTSETYKNEMQTEASSKAERIKNLEDELKPIFTSAETEREGMPVRHGSAATGFQFSGPAGDTKTNIYGFFPDDLEGEESSEQLHVAPAPNHLAHPPQMPINSKKDYEDADTSDGEDHVIDIAYDSKLNPEIQLEVEQSSEEENHNANDDILNGYGHREPLHSTEVHNQSPQMSHPDLDSPTGHQTHQILPPFNSKVKLTKEEASVKASAPLAITDTTAEAHDEEGDFGTRSEERQPSGFGSSVEETRPVMKFHNEPHHQFGEMPSASESTNVVQAPPASSEEERYDSSKPQGDWSSKASDHPSPVVIKNLTQSSHHPAQQNSLEEYSEEDPNYHYGTSLEEHLEKPNTTSSPTTTTTTATPRTRIVQVFAQPYNSGKTLEPSTTTSAPPQQAYDDYYSNESPESNKTGFVPPEPINFHDNQHNFASPEYTSKSGWRPLNFNHRKGSNHQASHHSNSLVTPGGQGVRAPSNPAPHGGHSTRPVELPKQHQRPRPPPPNLQPPSSSEEEPQKFKRPQQQQEDNTWTGIPGANILPNTVQKLPTRMKFPSESSAALSEQPRPTIRVPQPPQPLRHRTNMMHIDRNKYLQRPAVPPIIMRRLPQIQQNPIQTLQSPRSPPHQETPPPPSSVPPPPPPPPPHSSPPVVTTLPVSRRPVVQHRGPHQYLPPQRHHNQGPPPPPPPQQQQPPPSGSIHWPSDEQQQQQQRQQSLLDQRIQQQQNIIRRNSQYLLNRQRHQG